MKIYEPILRCFKTLLGCPQHMPFRIYYFACPHQPFFSVPISDAAGTKINGTSSSTCFNVEYILYVAKSIFISLTRIWWNEWVMTTVLMESHDVVNNFLGAKLSSLGIMSNSSKCLKIDEQIFYHFYPAFFNLHFSCFQEEINKCVTERDDAAGYDGISVLFYYYNGTLTWPYQNLLFAENATRPCRS